MDKFDETTFAVNLPDKCRDCPVLITQKDEFLETVGHWRDANSLINSSGYVAIACKSMRKKNPDMDAEKLATEVTNAISENQLSIDIERQNLLSRRDKIQQETDRLSEGCSGVGAVEDRSVLGRRALIKYCLSPKMADESIQPVEIRHIIDPPQK